MTSLRRLLPADIQELVGEGELPDPATLPDPDEVREQDAERLGPDGPAPEQSALFVSRVDPQSDAVKIELPDADSAHGSEFARSDDNAAAVAGADHVEETEGPSLSLKPNSHRHLALRAYADAFPDEITATEAGQRSTPAHDRVTGGTRRTYDLSKHGLLERGERGFTITDLGRRALAALDQGKMVKL